MLTGACLCGGVQYQYEGALTEIAICHCGQCRQAQGGVFATNAPILREKLTWIMGEDLLKDYFSSPNKRRVFCSTCGSPLFSQRMDMPDVVRLRLGTVTTDIDRTPDYHIYYQDRARWFEEVDGLPQFTKGKVEG